MFIESWNDEFPYMIYKDAKMHIKFIMTRHAIEQAKSRDVSEDTLKEVCKFATDYMKNHTMKFKHYLFYSKSLAQGIITIYQQDEKDEMWVRLPIITVLPKGKKFPKPGTELILTEAVLNSLGVELENYIMLP